MAGPDYTLSRLGTERLGKQMNQLGLRWPDCREKEVCASRVWKGDGVMNFGSPSTALHLSTGNPDARTIHQPFLESFIALWVRIGASKASDIVLNHEFAPRREKVSHVAIRTHAFSITESNWHPDFSTPPHKPPRSLVPTHPLGQFRVVVARRRHHGADCQQAPSESHTPLITVGQHGFHGSGSG